MKNIKKFHFGFYGGRGDLTFTIGGPQHQKGRKHCSRLLREIDKREGKMFEAHDIVKT